MSNTPTAATPRSALTALHETIAHDTTHAPLPSRAHISARTRLHGRNTTGVKTRQKSIEMRRITQTSTHSRRTLPRPRLRAARSPPYMKQSRTARHTRRATPPARRTGVARDHKYETQNTSKQDKIHGNQRIVITRGTGARDTKTPKNHPAHSTRPTVKHSRHHKRRHNSTPTPTPTSNNHTSYPPATQQPNNSTQTNPNQPKPTKPNSHTT